MQKAFKDYIGALVLHKNAGSGLYLRDDPTILGWELANNPVCPGDDSGDVLQVRHNRAHTIIPVVREMTSRPGMHIRDMF